MQSVGEARRRFSNDATSAEPHTLDRDYPGELGFRLGW